MRHTVAFRTDTCAKCARLITRGARIVLAYGKTFHADCTQVAQERRAA